MLLVGLTNQPKPGKGPTDMTSHNLSHKDGAAEPGPDAFAVSYRSDPPDDGGLRRPPVVTARVAGVPKDWSNHE